MTRLLVQVNDIELHNIGNQSVPHGYSGKLAAYDTVVSSSDNYNRKSPLSKYFSQKTAPPVHTSIQYRCHYKARYNAQ